MGFTFDDAAAAKGEAESLAAMRVLIEKDPRNAERIFAYIGGEEVNTDPRHAHHRYVIDFADFPLRRDASLKLWSAQIESEKDAALRKGIVPSDYPDGVAADWPDLLGIVERRVKPARLKLKDEGIAAQRKQYWWRYGSRSVGLYSTVAPLARVLVTLRVKEDHAVTFVGAPAVYANTLYVFSYTEFAALAVLQSRVHDLWIRKFSATLEERATYSSTDCFLPFPFPHEFPKSASLKSAGDAYHTFRAQLMIDRDEGLTKTYSRFHARGENAADIARLRALHAATDDAVLRAYGWDDLAERAAPEFIEQSADEGKTPKTRLDWPAEFKDEVLARLLALNAERAAAERAAGVTALLEDDEPVDDEDDN